MIYCIGDSNTSIFTGLGTLEEYFMQKVYPEIPQINILPNFKAFRIGAPTAYNFITKSHIIDKVIYEEQVNKENDYLLFSGGEIDCRIHLIKKSIEKNIDLENIIIECVNRYILAVIKYKNMGYNVIIYGPIPSTQLEQDEATKYYQHQVYGSIVERNNTNKKFNEMLKEQSQIHNIKFITVYDKVFIENKRDESLFLSDQVHLGQKALPLILTELEKINVISNSI